MNHIYIERKAGTEFTVLLDGAVRGPSRERVLQGQGSERRSSGARRERDVMPGPGCKSCTHDSRFDLDQDLANKIPMRTLAKVYGLSLAAIARHAKHRLARAEQETPVSRAEVTCETAHPINSGVMLEA